MKTDPEGKYMYGSYCVEPDSGFPSSYCCGNFRIFRQIFGRTFFSSCSDSASKEELAGNLNTTLNEILQFEYGINDFAEKASGLEVHLKVALLIEDLHFLQFQ